MKDALKGFARTRPDIIFELAVIDIIALAEVELTPRDKVERKLRSADKRMKDTFVLNRHGQGEGQHASFQDVLRVLWDWALTPEPAISAYAPGVWMPARVMYMM